MPNSRELAQADRRRPAPTALGQFTGVPAGRVRTLRSSGRRVDVEIRRPPPGVVVDGRQSREGGGWTDYVDVDAVDVIDGAVAVTAGDTVTVVPYAPGVVEVRIVERDAAPVDGRSVGE